MCSCRLSQTGEVTEILLAALSSLTLISVVLEMSELSLCSFFNAALMKYITHGRDKLKGDRFSQGISAFPVNRETDGKR